MSGFRETPLVAGEMNIIVTQLALIFFPGIIWAAVDSRYAARKEFSQFRLIISAFVFGTISYSVVYVIYSLIGRPFDIVGVVANGTKIKLEGTADEILSAVVVSVLLSLVWVYGSTYKFLNRFLRHIKATKRYGDEDVWDYVFNTSGPSSEFVNVRDFKKEIVYAGYVHIFSESEKLRELVLRDAKIYDFQGNELFDMANIYIARAPDDIHVEFPYRPE